MFWTLVLPIKITSCLLVAAVTLYITIHQPISRRVERESKRDVDDDGAVEDSAANVNAVSTASTQ